MNTRPNLTELVTLSLRIRTLKAAMTPTAAIDEALQILDLAEERVNVFFEAQEQNRAAAAKRREANDTGAV